MIAKIMIGRDHFTKKGITHLSCRVEGGYERHLVYFIIGRGNCFSILKSHVVRDQPASPLQYPYLSDHIIGSVYLLYTIVNIIFYLQK